MQVNDRLCISIQRFIEKTHITMNRRSILLLSLISCGLATNAAAQNPPNYPNKTVTLIVPYAAGGLTDVLARVLTPRLADKWGQSVLVENRAGGGTTIGTAVAAKAPGDGHTLLMTAFGFIGNQIMMPNLPYDPKALTPLFMVADSPSVLYVRASLPVNNLAELIAYGKANPGKLTFASSGNASSPHIAAEQFADMTGLQIVHVPYRGNGPAINDLLGGQVDALFDSPATMSHVATGKLKVLGHGYDQPNPRLPKVPAISQAGIPSLSQFMAGGWFGIFIPTSTPENIQQKIYADMKTVVENKDVREALMRTGVDVRSMTRAEFATYLQGELTRWGPVIRSRNIRPD
jgi:tripartite-type tricarboxylate transporter receptor subunit TctC